jgi:hypothetical protein
MLLMLLMLLLLLVLVASLWVVMRGHESITHHCGTIGTRALVVSSVWVLDGHAHGQ